MPTQQKIFQDAVDQVLEAVMFENWLRFYFIAETPDVSADGDGASALRIAVPDKGMARIKEGYSLLSPMAEAMNGSEANFENSRRAVCTFVLERLDGKTMPRDTARLVLESATFQARLQLFNIWVQAHEDRLDEQFLEFSAWRSLFADWLQQDDVRAQAEKLLLGMAAGTGRGEAAEQ
ncbi:MAG: hypothetical protein LBR31_06485 [Desulfovibrio sp.]|jgi:hypothetical protein|nr:hypothetical protein [Desulfovibrio sp.]